MDEDDDDDKEEYDEDVEEPPALLTAAAEGSTVKAVNLPCCITFNSPDCCCFEMLLFKIGEFVCSLFLCLALLGLVFVFLSLCSCSRIVCLCSVRSVCC